MKISQHEQGTPEWKNDRAGVITASMFLTIRSKVGLPTEQQQQFIDAKRAGYDDKAAMAIAGYKAMPTSSTIKKALAGEKLGEFSSAAKEYAFRLACERLAGASLDDQYETYAMRRGKELEDGCRVEHEIDINTMVDTAGFIKTDDDKFGCSADSLIEDDGGGEYKCFFDPAKLEPIMLRNDWGDIMDQVQGCMWITGRKWWDMCLYVPALRSAGLHFFRYRVLRDDDYIEAMEDDLMEFSALVDSLEKQLIEIAQTK